MLSRRQLLVGIAWGAGALSLSARADEPQDMLARGAAWLLAQQAKDGGWHSEAYGALRAGAATTALAMYALCHLHPKHEQQKVNDALARGLEFLMPGIKKRGFVACPDGSLDYPTYGTAMLATAAQLRDFGLSKGLREKFIDWVVSGQLHESREFTTNSPHYGGWDLMGASQVVGLTSDTTVSCSCYALEAIHRGKSAEIKRTLERARAWTERCQDLRDSGGFRFSPDPMSINHKAGWHDDEQTAPKAYASATADGLRCLRYAATSDDDDRHIAAAEKYLAAQTEVAHVPGFSNPEDLHGWALGLRFYYYQSLTKAIAPIKADWATKRRADIGKQLRKTQHKDGRWQNESARMREDDPLIATSLALTAAALLA